MNKILKRVLIIFGVILALLAGTVIFALIRSEILAGQIFDDYSDIYSNQKYQTALYVDNANFVKQEVSCGYAVIEMFAKWTGDKNITEKSLYDTYGGAVTSTGGSFEEEMNKQFPGYKTTMYKNLKNTELVDKVYDSLSQGVPVPFEWAAKKDDEWTLHYSLITGIDIPNDLVVIQNPYGYEEKIKIEEFLGRTSFRAYENIPLFLKLGFAFGIFERNTIFVPVAKQ